uniref:Tyrosine aminotransferase n=1 Tax=Caenorhabditis japonica TaxID=281687 RepID=A0A8R1DM57_CAEJA
MQTLLPNSRIMPPPGAITKQEIKNQLIAHERRFPSKLAQKADWNVIPQSVHSKNTVNPVRKIADACAVSPNPDKRVIRLHLGDPSVGGKLPPSEVAVQAMKESVDSHCYDGYGPAVGALAARQAIVDRYSTPSSAFTADDVVLASGCSHALQMAIEAVANPGDSILVPHPGFPLYSTLCRPHNIVDKPYKINMTGEEVRIDFSYMATVIDENTKAIIINNPGNPTGGVFTKEHLEEILAFAEKYKLIVIADEIYGDLVFNGATFYPLASLSPKVPVITCDGIAKRWMVPGWRLGWIIIHNRFGVLSEVKKGIVALSQKIVGPCALVQGALPKILKETPEEYFVYTRNVIEENANTVANILESAPGIRVVKPKGAMYMMVAVSKSAFGSDVNFCQNLIKEESVFCLPGQAFSAPGYFRLVLTSSTEEMEEAAVRISEFCLRHFNQSTDSEDSSDEGLDLSAIDSD